MIDTKLNLEKTLEMIGDSVQDISEYNPMQYELDMQHPYVKKLKEIRKAQKTEGFDSSESPLLSRLYIELISITHKLLSFPWFLLNNLLIDAEPIGEDLYTLKEAISNSVEHGARFCENGPVTIEYFNGANTIAAVITDPGLGFDFVNTSGRGGMQVFSKYDSIKVGFEKFESGFRTIIVYNKIV